MRGGHLFIIGAARSGTTVLQNALNDSADVFLLGEPDLRGDTAPGFAARYNARQREWGNQETKSSFCPALLAHDGTWRDYLDALRAKYRWVGAKVVINPVRPMNDLAKMFDFYCQNFYDAHYIFTFRDPLATVLSTRDLQMLSQGETDGVRVIMRSFAEVLALFIRMLRNLPHVRAVIHEDVDAETFRTLQQWLDVSLAGSYSYYRSERIRGYEASQLHADDLETLQALRECYDDLRGCLVSTFEVPQLEQNDKHLNMAHYTVLGSLDRRARMLSAQKL